MSPHLQQRYDDKQESQLPSTESELIHSLAQHSTEDESRPVRVSPFQVESILGIRNDKPIELDSLRDVNSVGGQESNSMMSPQDRVLDGSQESATQNNLHVVGDTNSQPKTDPLLPIPPSNFDPFTSPTTEEGSIVKVHVYDCDVYVHVHIVWLCSKSCSVRCKMHFGLYQALSVFLD